MEIYRHTQRGTLIVASLSAVIVLDAVILAVIAVTEETPAAAIAIASAVLLLLAACVWVFGSLTVAVAPGAVAVWFGPGAFKKTIQANAIRGARAVRNSWILGWGIRWVPRGWMYNVSGLDAVELELATGRVFRIGTDEPDRLLAAIEGALGARA